MRHTALFASLAALALVAVPAIAFADDAVPAVDLIGKIVLGTDDGSTLAIQDGAIMGTVEHSSPGQFGFTGADGSVVTLKVAEKSSCVYDISFSLGGTVAGGIEVDATKLKTVTYALVDKKDKYSDYTITLDGGDNIVQLLGPDGALSPTGQSSTISTSLTIDDMNAAVTQLQATYCKPMA